MFTNRRLSSMASISRSVSTLTRPPSGTTVPPRHSALLVDQVEDRGEMHGVRDDAAAALTEITAR